MAEQITNITVVGGGTAGWLAAAYLNHRLQWGLTARPGVRISVIESPDIPTIGVGEATVPTMKGTLRILEISETEFIKRTNATLKLGILFNDWQTGADGGFASYVHPFTGGADVRGRNPGYSFLAHGMPGNPDASGADFVDLISHARPAMQAMRGARGLDDADFAGPLRYAYHLDAALFAGFLKEICVARGVEHIADNVIATNLDERGYIASLDLERAGRHPVELVIDCTGFRGLLINEALGEPFLSMSDHLLNDRAVPLQFASPEDDIAPYTVAHALKSGWSWRIPLVNRQGMGYVYSSQFTSDDAALDELIALTGSSDSLVTPRVIKMRVGRSRRSWVKNCVAIGGSSSFAEPLESTTIMMIELASRWLLQNFPTTDYEEPLQRQFNRAVENAFDHVRDFITLHFRLSNRDDSDYWRAVRHEAKISDKLAEHLELWKYALPSDSDMWDSYIFGPWSIQSVLFGKGYYDGAKLNPSEVVPEEVWRWYCADMRARRSSLLDRLPPHADLVAALRERAQDGDTAARTPKGRTFEFQPQTVFENSRIMASVSDAA